jgi:long-chain acyl-CoA synthetase
MNKIILDYVYDHESGIGHHTVLIQPCGSGHVVEYTWRAVLDQARRMAAHLKSRGIRPGAQVALLSKNCAHFLMAELAVWMAGGTTVAIFPTERADVIRYILEHCEASLLFVGKLDTWNEQAQAVPPGLPCIALPLAPATDFDTWDAIVALTEPLPGRPSRDPDDIAMLLYTSGSTGEPKGVMHSFRTITRVAELSADYLRQLLPDDIERRMLSYLPLAHVYERAAVECHHFIEGRGRIYFTESLQTFVDDIKRARPTVFCSVPRLWLKFQQLVLQATPAATLDAMLSDPGRAHAVKSDVLASLGLDQVRLATSGSAPLPPTLLSWYRRLGLNLLEGYAMTEDFCYSHLSTADGIVGYVGIPRSGVEARIDEGGEILIKSPGQLVGYYKRPDLNQSCFTEDGYFRTGDLGERMADGQLKITGRAKELFKTAKGKYIAPAPIENYLNEHPMIDQSIVAGLGQAAPFAVVVLAEHLRPQLGTTSLQSRVEMELVRLHKEVNARLATYEQLRMLVIAREPWSIDNGCLTPTLKLKRSRIETSFAPLVEGWYQRPGPVMWA